jgi:protein-S-isoprenylcysteine O-methyltransferase Ste14
MYVGLTLILGGVGLSLGTLGALLPLPVFLALITHHFVRDEEKFLEGIFGEEYLSYKRRVRRWI